MIKAPQPANAHRFHDRVAVVTGAAGGIGSAVAERLAAEGARVFVCDVAAAGAEAVARRIGADPLAFDLSDPDACTGAMQSVADQAGRIDVLVNNGGINRRGPLLDLSPDDWTATFAVNVDALFHLCRVVLPLMVEAGSGSIVNTASQWGLVPGPGHIAYNASKAAVVSFTPKSGPRLCAVRHPRQRRLPGRGANRDARVQPGPHRPYLGRPRPVGALRPDR